MRIGYFVWEYPPRLVGGLGTYADEMTGIFAKLKHNVSVFTLNPDNLKTSEIINNIEVHRPKVVDAVDVLPMIISNELIRWGAGLKFFNDIFSYNYLSASKFINQVAEKKKFDIVAIHDWLSAIAGLIIKKTKPELPLVFHVHSTEQQRSSNGSHIIKEIEFKMAKQADMIITVSYSMREHLIQLGYPKDKIKVVWNGCDPDVYNPKKVDSRSVDNLRNAYKINKDEKVIFFIGRLTWIKGVENLILAFSEVLKKFPKTKLIILGKGEEYDDLVELSKRLDIADKIVIRSAFVTEKERIAHYALSDVCVFPSFSEPFGIVSLEAMSMEKPVVVGASGINGFKEQIIPSGDERCGVHVDGRKPEDIAWGIEEVLKNPERAKQWARNARKRVEEYFSLEKVAKSTLNFYKECTKI